MPDKTIAENIGNIISYGGLGGLGGLAVYLNQIRKGTKFNIFMMVINILLAGWIGWLSGDLLPNNEFKNSLVSISGFLAYPILDLLEEKGLSLLIKRYLGNK